MKLYLEKRVVFGFILTLGIVAGLAIYSYTNSKKFNETNKLVLRTNKVLFHTEQVLNMMLNLETSQRGFVITGDSIFITPINNVGDTVVEHIENLVLLTRDNVSQQPRLIRLKQLIAQKIKFRNDVVKARSISFEIAKDSVITLNGKLVTDQIVGVITDIQKEESILLAERIQASEERFTQFNYALIKSLIVIGFIIILVFVTLHFNLRARTLAEVKLLGASNEIHDLYDNAPCGYHSLNENGLFVEMNNTMLTWLGYKRSDVLGKMNIFDVLAEASAALFKSNFTSFIRNGFINNLEFDFVRKDQTIFPGIISATAIIDKTGRYVKSRTTVFDISSRKQTEIKVWQLNAELEAFTYSVSHDLRAPLRSINGYARILEEDYGDKLDQEGKRIVHVIINNAKRMGQLIDDLLDFSRVGRKEIIKTPHHVEDLVHSVFSELIEHETTRQIDFIVSKLEPCTADIRMMRQVWLNLISNALKYTQKNLSTNIEVSSYRESKQVVYAIKDNGVGFDMLYVSKLFGVFQRLHKAQDFEGTGVGLAIVKRIIDKHGGRVWVNSKMNEGTTFYFSLPIE